MPRGGARDGAGRKGEGLICKSVSLALPKAIWTEMNQANRTPSFFVRDLYKENDHLKKELERLNEMVTRLEKEKMIKPNEENRLNVKNKFSKADFDHAFNLHIRYLEKKPVEQVVHDAKSSLQKYLFSGGREFVDVEETRLQFRCPFTGKWFGSVDKLVLSAIPSVLQMVENEEKNRQDNLERLSKKQQHFFDIF